MSKISGKYDTKELNGIPCAIVETGVSPVRVDFLRRVLMHNGYEVQVTENAPPKHVEGELATQIHEPTFTIGVTDITFNISLALFGRHLKTLDNQILLPHYWQ